MNHVNTKIVFGLGAAVLFAVSLAALLSWSGRSAEENGQTGTYVLPELHGHVDAVRSVDIVVAGEKPAVSLQNGGDGWKVSEKAGYPADTGKLRNLLLSLADARLLDAKTASEQHYADLAVEEVKSPDAKGVLVKLDGLAKPAQLIVGKQSSTGDGTYVRRADDKQSWLVAGRIDVERDPAKWLDSALLDIGAERIAEVVLDKPGGKSLRLYKANAGDGNFQVAGIPAGRELQEPAAVNGLASTLSGLTLQDVVSSQSTVLPDGKALLKAQFRGFDGLVIQVSAWTQDDKHYAGFEAMLDRERAEAFIGAEQAKAKADGEALRKAAAEHAGQQADPAKTEPPASPAVADPAKFRQERLDGLQAETAKLNQRLQGWYFVIPAFKFDNMNKSQDDVLKPLSQAKTAAGKPAAKKKPASGKR